MAIPPDVAQMESKGRGSRTGDGVPRGGRAAHVVNSSLSQEPHGYPVQLGPVVCRKCGAPALG